MQRFIKMLAYGFAATAMTVFTVGTADAQKGGGHSGGGAPRGGSMGSMGGGFKGSNMGGFPKGPSHAMNSNHNTPTFKQNGTNPMKQQGQFQHHTNKPDFAKNGQMGKGFAKGEPNPSAPGGMKYPGNQKGPHKDFFCGTPYGGKYTPYCNNWKGCYPNWGFNCGWNYGCYPFAYGSYCWPKSCWYPCYYPVSYVAPVSYCFTPVCYAQPTYVPTVVQEIVQPVAAPVEQVTTTNTITKTASQQVTQTAAAAPAPVDSSFLTMSVFNQ